MMSKINKTVDISGWPVMKKRCSSCPFGNKGEKDRAPDIANKVRMRCLQEASQICHHPRLSNKEESHLCRGARDFQLEIFSRLGVIDDATDEAWQIAHAKLDYQKNE